MPNLSSVEIDSGHYEKLESLRNEIYLDNHASTRCDPRAVEAMLPFLVEEYANPSSNDHRAGLRAKQAVDTSRSHIAKTVQCSPGEIVFTSSATESNNLALLGIARASSERRHLIVSAVEHKSVLEPAHWLESQGFPVTVVPVDCVGTVDLDVLKSAITSHTLLVSIQLANNEIGTIQPIEAIVEIAHSMGALVHVDGAQALGRMPVSLSETAVDFASFSAHKCYGPKGVGALFVRGGGRATSIEPILRGGGQESGLRSGTLNVPAIVGFGIACSIANSELDIESKRIGELRDLLEESLLKIAPGSWINGSQADRLAGNCSITLPGIEGSALLANVRNVVLSSGSACNSSSTEPSHVLRAIGLTAEDAASTVRFGVGRYNSRAEIEQTVRYVGAAMERIQALPQAN